MIDAEPRTQKLYEAAYLAWEVLVAEGVADDDPENAFTVACEKRIPHARLLKTLHISGFLSRYLRSPSVGVSSEWPA